MSLPISANSSLRDRQRDHLSNASMQTSASAPLLQGVKKAVRVSVIAMGAAPLAPKEPEKAPETTALIEDKVQCRLFFCTNA